MTVSLKMYNVNVLLSVVSKPFDINNSGLEFQYQQHLTMTEEYEKWMLNEKKFW